MATKTFEGLKQLAIQIRDEKTNKQNTATRIGTQMLEHLDKLEQDYYDKTATDEELKERDEKLTELESKLVILDNEEPITFDEAISKIKNKQENMIITFNKLNVGTISYQLLDINNSNSERSWVRFNSGFRLGYVDTSLELKNSTTADYTYHYNIVPVIKGNKYRIEYKDSQYNNIVAVVAGYDSELNKFTKIYIQGIGNAGLISKEFVADDDYIAISVN